jgi:molecular chaperone GrpE
MNKKKDKVKKQKQTKKTTSSTKVKSLNKKIDSLTEELDNLKEKNLRILAEFENFKKRTNQNLSDSHSRNLEKIIASFLPVMDDLDRVLDNKDTDDFKLLIDSIDMIKNKIINIFEKYNVSSFSALGYLFDTNLHEAIMMQESKEKENTIINEFEKGYKINDKIIRHSKVIVSKGSK